METLYMVKIGIADYNDYDAVCGWEYTTKAVTAKELDDMFETEMCDEGLDIEPLFTALKTKTEIGENPFAQQLSLNEIW